jgi:hypothetical protein
MEAHLPKRLSEDLGLMLLGPRSSLGIIRLTDIRMASLYHLNRYIKVLLEESAKLKRKNPVPIIHLDVDSTLSIAETVAVPNESPRVSNATQKFDLDSFFG